MMDESLNSWMFNKILNDLENDENKTKISDKDKALMFLSTL